MSRTIEVKKWCDWCRVRDGGRAVAEHTVTVGISEGEGRPALRVLDLCDVDRKALDDLIELLPKLDPLDERRPLATGGEADAAPARRADDVVRKGRTPEGARDWECERCDADYATRQGLAAHIWKAHQGRDKPASPTICPTCGYEGTASGVAAHRSSQHSYDQVRAAYAGTT